MIYFIWFLLKQDPGSIPPSFFELIKNTNVGNSPVLVQNQTMALKKIRSYLIKKEGKSLLHGIFN